MLATAKARGFDPKYVSFDSWYSGLDNLKAVRGHGWHFLSRLKCNRQVNPDGSGNIAVETLDVPEIGLVVHLKGFGFIRLFRTAALDGDAEYWATSDLDMSDAQRRELERQCFLIENYHRGLKQCCGIERAQVRKAQAQRNHILFALRAFVRLELHRLQTGLSWYEAKTHIVRQAIRSYLAGPSIVLPNTA
jgi:putative transposase